MAAATWSTRSAFVTVFFAAILYLLSSFPFRTDYITARGL
ncbi:hypothetical protein TCCBUS3UF1_18160 [Thermus sp. CCB_US3_UF1]|nr:hypothetical protein TCCBUS3UF1_18160 [Thermus sp. CCB_US3_UF1]